MGFIIMFAGCLLAALIQNVWLAIGAIVVGFLMIQAEVKWLHHHMHEDNSNHEEDL